MGEEGAGDGGTGNAQNRFQTTSSRTREQEIKKFIRNTSYTTKKTLRVRKARARNTPRPCSPVAGPPTTGRAQSRPNHTCRVETGQKEEPREEQERLWDIKKKDA